jgi:MFS family permease
MKNWKVILLGGIAALFTAMGMGRFVYTPAVTFMLESNVLNTADAGLIASSNFAGYLIGAMFYSFYRPKRFTFEIALILSVLTTALFPVYSNILWWILIRFLSGFYSAAVFISATERVYAALHANNKQSYGGLLFSGIGAGIVFSSWIAPFTAVKIGWEGVWYYSGVACIIITLIAIFSAGGTKSDERHKSEIDNTGFISFPMIFLSCAYMLEGAGYIIAGTFLVDIIKDTSGIANAGFIGWALAGGTAVFSNIMWSWAGHKFGLFKVFTVLLILQAIGMLLPVFSDSVNAAYGFAVIFGGTFLGAVALAFACGRHILPKGNTAPILTVFYSIGQIISPWIGGMIAYKSGSFIPALIFSAVLIVGSAVLIVMSGTALHKRSEQCHS